MKEIKLCPFCGGRICVRPMIGGIIGFLCKNAELLFHSRAQKTKQKPKKHGTPE